MSTAEAINFVLTIYIYDINSPSLVNKELDRIESIKRSCCEGYDYSTQKPKPTS